MFRRILKIAAPSDEPGGCRNSDSARPLYIVLCFDLFITLVEFIGAISSGSLVLWENVGVGVVDGCLLAFNIRGLKKEACGTGAQGAKIAYWSDIVLAGVMSLAIIAGLTRLIVSTNGIVNGNQVFGVAAFATFLKIYTFVSILRKGPPLSKKSQ